MSEPEAEASSLTSKDNNTAALLEKLTQLVALRQTQIMVIQHNPNPAVTIPTAETFIHPSPISMKLNGKNYSL